MIAPSIHDSSKTFFLILLSFTGIIILRNAWVSDDSYIGFRTVYNFVNGYGLTFNINERVQSFTNPLWILLMSFFYLFTGEAYFTSIFLSLAISLVTLYLLVRKFSDNDATTLMIFALVCTSKAFIDYSTSGLENNLGHLFVVLFAIVYMSERRDRKRLFLLFFIASLAAVNRLDNILIYLIPLCLQFKYLSRRNLLIIFAGTLPLILWELFSLLYFGFLFPNTYFTKLNTQIPSSEYFSQGFRYLINSLDMDAITLLTIFTGLLSAFYFSYKTKDFKLLSFGISILIFLFYIIKVGGDFMSGRFFTYIFLLSIVILTKVKLSQSNKLAIISIAILISVIAPYSPVKSNSNYRKNETSFNEVVINEGIADERAWYQYHSGLIKLKADLPILKNELGLDTVTSNHKNIVSFQEIYEVLGFQGYSLGPHVYIFHHMGLTDPLIARLPRDLDASPTWRIGHILRKIPEGYKETLETGINNIKDPDLASYYNKLTIITRGKIFSWNRIATIINMNLGKYDRLIDIKKYSGGINIGSH